MLACLIYESPEAIHGKLQNTQSPFGTYPNAGGGNVVVEKTLGVQVLHAAHNLGEATTNDTHANDIYPIELLKT